MGDTVTLLEAPSEGVTLADGITECDTEAETETLGEMEPDGVLVGGVIEGVGETEDERVGERDRHVQTMFG